VVAEGVETPEQRDILADMGVDAGQGYLFSRPMAGSDIIAKFSAQPIWSSMPKQAS